MPEPTSLPPGAKIKGPSNTGVVKLVGQTPLAQEYIIPGRTFGDALARTTIQDPNFLNNIVLLNQQMDLFDKRGKFKTRKDALINLLNGQNALKGYNRSLSAMVGTGIYLPEGAGIKLSKEDKKAYAEVQKARYSQNGNNGDGSGKSQ